ncbi:MAG: hypothetical protein DRI84_03320 [Bacteroidetes bacterium]|nr:MAG: hypothetical protein DRI84_03320 [Bacteroidota bacterium]
MAYLLSASVAKKLRFKEPPPGTVRLTDSLYIDRSPVRVVDYLEFLSAIRNSYSPRMHDSIQELPNFGLSVSDVNRLRAKMPWDSIYYLRMLTRTWTTYANDIQKFDVDYHIKNPRFYDYPIININYKQVVEYCKWRTDMVKLHYAMLSSNEKQRRHYPMNFEYRLPNKKEWDKVIGRFFSKIEKLDKLTTNKGGLLQNMVSPYANKKTFQYQSSNVGEMLDKYIATVGFAWDESLNLGSIQYVRWEEPVDWIGFRCICEVLPEDGAKKKLDKSDVKRDKFGKIIYDPNKNKEKNKKKTPEPKESEVQKSKKTKKSKSKNKPESVGKKRKKRK